MSSPRGATASSGIPPLRPLANGASPSDLRRLNEQVVLSAMSGGQWWRATELMHTTGLTRVTVMDVLRQLETRDWLGSETAGTGERGRPATKFRRREPDGVVLGVEVGAHDVSVTTIDLSGEVLHRSRANVTPDLPRDQRIETALTQVDDCLAACGRQRHDVWTVQVGTTGTITDTGSVLRSTAISDWTGVDLRGLLTQRLELPVQVGNDIQLVGADQQQWGAAAGSEHVLVLWLGRRPAASLVLDGAPYSGAHGTAGDLSRIGLLPEDTSWNGSGSWLPPLEIDPADSDTDAFRAALALARDGDPQSLAAFTQWLERLAPVISLFAAVVDPEAVVVAGPLASLGEVVTDLLGADLERHLQNRPLVVLAEGGDSSVADAAARHAVHQVHQVLIEGNGKGVAPLRRDSYLDLASN